MTLDFNDIAPLPDPTRRTLAMPNAKNCVPNCSRVLNQF